MKKHLLSISFTIKALLLLTVVGMVLILNLLNNVTLGNFYVTVAEQIPVDNNWVSSNTILVSDVGHAVSGFLLAILILLNVRKYYYSYLIMLAGFAIVCELMQLFTTTRQFKLLDIGYSLGGIGVASCLFLLIKHLLPVQWEFGR